jgi:hypothetical protein
LIEKEKPMGDRVIVQVGTKDNFGPVLYGHWCGHDMPLIVRKWAARMASRKGDVSYLSARLLQDMIGKDQDQTGFGILNAIAIQEAGDSHGDAGVIVVDPQTFYCTCSGGYLVTDKDGFPSNPDYDSDES